MLLCAVTGLNCTYLSLDTYSFHHRSCKCKIGIPTTTTIYRSHTLLRLQMYYGGHVLVVGMLTLLLICNTWEEVWYCVQNIIFFLSWSILLAMWQSLTASDVRLMDIYVNSKVLASGVNVFSSAKNALYVPIEVATNSTPMLPTNNNITIAAAWGSTLGPSINAAELHYIFPFQPRTSAGDSKRFGLLQLTV